MSRQITAHYSNNDVVYLDTSNISWEFDFISETFSQKLPHFWQLPSVSYHVRKSFQNEFCAIILTNKSTCLPWDISESQSTVRRLACVNPSTRITTDPAAPFERFRRCHLMYLQQPSLGLYNTSCYFGNDKEPCQCCCRANRNLLP